jgi:hypothetical protein
MGAVEDKIRAMGHSLPEPFKFPKPNRTGCVVVGSIVFASGHGRNMGGPGVKSQGKLGKDLTELFGPKAGQHARTAVGMAELPHGIPVEINGEFELKA